jgi:hypothetical protein
MTITLPTDFGELRDRLQTEFADMLAPDLATNGASQIHIVVVSETDLMANGEFFGLTSPHIHRWLKTYIPHWRGPAPAMLIDDVGIVRAYRGRLDDAASEFTGIVTHEMAHIACVPGLYARDDEQPDAGDGSDEELFAMSIRMPEKEFAPARAARSVRVGHEWPFLRECLHIRHRLERRGIECLMPLIVPHPYYGISTLATYWRALGDEPERLESLPLTSISDIDPPERFVDLWNSDLATWPDAE